MKFIAVPSFACQFELVSYINIILFHCDVVYIYIYIYVSPLLYDKVSLLPLALLPADEFNLLPHYIGTSLAPAPSSSSITSVWPFILA